MNPETYKAFSDEMVQALMASFATKEVEEFVSKTKAADDSGTFEVIITTEDTDRQGEIVELAGMEMERYMQNPVVLFGHDYRSLPIGIADEVYIKDGKRIAKGRFAPMEANPFAQQVRKLYDMGILRATSVGFIIKEKTSERITKSELLEFSFVPVPANPYALDTRLVRENGIDVAMFAAKGINLEVKEEAPTVQTEIDERAKREAKYKNLQAFDDVVYAFYNAYLDDEAEPDTFKSMVAEVIKLLEPLAGDMNAENSYKALAEYLKAPKSHKAARKHVAGQVFKGLREDVGAGLVQMQGDVDDALARGAMDILALIEATPEAKQVEEPKIENVGDAPKEDVAGDTQIRSNPVPAKLLQDLNLWEGEKTVKELMRIAVTALSEALRATKEKERK